ncbi:dTDP-4-dehydrorhamnose 3,5-epimerase family protein [bacterium]|nr:dTDP-4-dehydrorhamnose 3,5-epimerase family protein [bacterium]
MIDEVKIKELHPIPDERGRLMELLRYDDDIFEEFGQVYITTTLPGVVKAWHYHKIQDDFIAAVEGMIKLVLFDARKDSNTYGEINEWFIGIHNPLLIKIPHGVYHGWKCVSEKEAIVVNCPNKPYNRENPDEYREDPFENNIPYNWELKQG